MKALQFTSTVILIMRMESSLLFESLADCSEVWIADTPEHAALKGLRSSRQCANPCTWFPLKADETLADAAMRICPSLDAHYDEDAKPPGYRRLIVFGVEYHEELNAHLEPLGFQRVEPTSFGFVAGK